MSNLPSTMKAIEISEPGGPEVLQVTERPVPAPAHGDVLVRVAAAGVNRPDVAQRAGAYPPPPGASDLPGLEIAGEVVALGEGVTQWAVGDKVMALTPGGGYAEYCTTPAAHCLPVPDGMEMTKAAAIPETFFTVWTNVFERGGLQGGETFLVHGGSSGIGTTAIQLAKAFGARVFATAGSADKCEACVKLGAERAINYRDEDFVEVVQELTDGKGVNVILDMVGGPYVERNLKALSLEGRLVQIAFLNGPKAEKFSFLPIMMKRLTFTGSTLRPQSVERKAEIASALSERVLPLIGAGAVGPVMDTVYPYTDAVQAHQRMEEGDHIGKLVLQFD